MPISPAPQAAAAPPVQFLDRDHSILAFTERVLDWAKRPDVPLLERLRFLCIVSSNLDEFFEVRAAPHLTAAQSNEQKGLYTALLQGVFGGRTRHGGAPVCALQRCSAACL